MWWFVETSLTLFFFLPRKQAEVFVLATKKPKQKGRAARSSISFCTTPLPSPPRRNRGGYYLSTHTLFNPSNRTAATIGSSAIGSTIAGRKTGTCCRDTNRWGLPLKPEFVFLPLCTRVSVLGQSMSKGTNLFCIGPLPLAIIITGELGIFPFQTTPEIS